MSSRRSISVNGDCYDLALGHCTEKGLSVSSYVQAAVIEKMRREGVEVPEGIEDKPQPLSPGLRNRMVRAQRAGREQAAAERYEHSGPASNIFTF